MYQGTPEALKAVNFRPNRSLMSAGRYKDFIEQMYRKSTSGFTSQLPLLGASLIQVDNVVTEFDVLFELKCGAIRFAVFLDLFVRSVHWVVFFV